MNARSVRTGTFKGENLRVLSVPGSSAKFSPGKLYSYCINYTLEDNLAVPQRIIQEIKRLFQGS